MTFTEGLTLADGAQIVLAWIISTVLFAALIIYISKHPQKRTTPLKSVFIFMFLGGMAIYCTCHYFELKNPSPSSFNSSLKWTQSPGAPSFFIPYTIIRSVIDVGSMFYGRVNFDAFYNLPVSENPLAVLLFWMIHLTAFYTTATALLIRFGNDLLRWIRIMTSKISDVDLVFGVNPDSLVFGRNIADTKGSMIIYVDSIIREDYESSIRDMGGLTYSTKDALKAAPSFLKNIRIKPQHTKLRLYALSEEYDRNLQYARIMAENLENAGILPEQTELVLLGSEEWKGMHFQAAHKHYGYGSVVSFDEFEMSARLLMHEYPLCSAINFDSDGKASENMDVLIVGFGKMGHEVLRKAIANGQFEGSKFHATIYEPNFEQLTGFFSTQYPGMFVNYDVDFEPHGGRGRRIYRYIQDNAYRLKYIVVCLEDRDTARDVAVHIVDRLQAMGYPLNVYTCDSKSVRCYSKYARECATHWIYDSELLYSGELDMYAKELNHRYDGRGTLEEDWKNCKYFDRMSSRASVDYLIPLISRILKRNGTGRLTPEQRENLARSEHLRWCAFHYTFGYDLMEREEFVQRVKNRQSEIRDFGRSEIKTTKDTRNKTHICLVSWDELDEISRLENSITHGTKNYKDSDRSNVDMVRELLQDSLKEENHDGA